MLLNGGYKPSFYVDVTTLRKMMVFLRIVIKMENKNGNVEISLFELNI